MSVTKGVFLSDIHMPDNINLSPVVAYVKDLKPSLIILGGDIVDAKGMHGVDHMPLSAVDVWNYTRDIVLIRDFVGKLKRASPNARIVYMEGNHEERYRRLAIKYPKVFAEKFNIPRDAGIPWLNWVEYGTYGSYIQVGDCIFIHGNIWPDLHARAYAVRYTPNKVVYGHLHHFQAYTTHRASPSQSPRYAVTAGCLCKLDPEWKKGEGHKWVNGFVSFISENGVTVPTAHLIEGGKFNVGGKIYG